VEIIFIKVFNFDKDIETESWTCRQAGRQE
jgi:hypothetical protein